MDTTISLPHEDDLLSVNEITAVRESGPGAVAGFYGSSIEATERVQLDPSNVNLYGVLHHKQFKKKFLFPDDSPIAQQNYEAKFKTFEQEVKTYEASDAVGPPPYPPDPPTITKEITGTEIIIFPGLVKYIDIPFEEFCDIYIQFIQRKQLSI